MRLRQPLREAVQANGLDHRLESLELELRKQVSQVLQRLCAEAIHPMFCDKIKDVVKPLTKI